MDIPYSVDPVFVMRRKREIVVDSNEVSRKNKRSQLGWEGGCVLCVNERAGCLPFWDSSLLRPWFVQTDVHWLRLVLSPSEPRQGSESVSSKSRRSWRRLASLRKLRSSTRKGPGVRSAILSVSARATSVVRC